jgi:diadenosine tetraphosphate (Ap4A) HIT family hydrolase
MSPVSQPAGGTGKDSTFSQIIAGKLHAKWVENEPSSPVVCFHNRLKWARVMLLVVPRDYMTQSELWLGDVLQDVLRLAVRVGEEHSSEGFRIISNFGPGAHQSQSHAHIHVVSGLAKNIAVAKHMDDWEQAGRVLSRHVDVQSAPHAALYRDDLSSTQFEFLTGEGAPLAAEVAIAHAKKFSPTGFRLKANYAMTQRNTPRGGEPGLFMLGGGQLPLYI